MGELNSVFIFDLIFDIIFEVIFDPNFESMLEPFVLRSRSEEPSEAWATSDFNCGLIFELIFEVIFELIFEVILETRNW